MGKVKMGDLVKTRVDKLWNEGSEKVFIPQGTAGIVCDVPASEQDWVLVEIWGEGAPSGVSGVFEYRLDELLFE